MFADHAADHEIQALEMLRALGLGPEARVLALGPPATAHGRAATPAPWRLERPPDPEALDFFDATFDAAVVTGTLERLEWDSWELQQVHRLLKDGGWLALAVPNLTGILSPGAWGFLLRRSAQRASRLLRTRPGGRRPEPGAFEGRRYLGSALASMLERLHYRVESWSSRSFADPRQSAAPALPGARELGSHHFVIATRQPGLAARVRAGSAPDVQAYAREYEAANRRLLEIREAWLARHPRFRCPRPEPLDVAACAGRNVLMLAPHPDDELVGCGGTLLELIEHGARVTIVQATDGSASSALRHADESLRTSIRLEEARAVGEALGASRIVYWREDNRALRCRGETVEQLRVALAELRPAMIFTPFVTDIHPDHFELNRILERALASAPFDASGSQILYSEIWSLVPANVLCDVTAVEERVERLIMMYPTAMKVDDLVHLCEARNYYNACRLLGRSGFVEAFLAVPTAAHAEIMKSVEAPDA